MALITDGRPQGPTPQVEAEAEALFWRLNDEPMTMESIMGEFGWTYGVAKKRIEVAREFICPLLGAAIPRAIQDDGYTYKVIDRNNLDGPALQRSTTVAIADSETRLKTIHRVAKIGKEVFDGRTRHGKAADIMEFRVRQAIEELARLDA